MRGFSILFQSIQEENSVNKIYNIFHQTDNIKYIKNTYGKEIWVQVAGNINSDVYFGGFWCALISLKRLKTVFRDVEWDSSIGTYLPGFVQSGSKTYYERFPDEDYHCESIVHQRDFYGIKSNYVELCEEFRFLNNLYHNINENKYYAVLENGEVEEASRIENQRDVYIKLSYLIRYATAKQMAILLFFDIKAEIEGTLSENGLTEFTDTVKNKNIFYEISGQNLRGVGKNYSYSRLIGKKILYPQSVEKCGYWPYDKKTEYEEFCIGINEDGTEKMYTSDPSKLSNYFGANPGAPHQLTPVFFKKEVLQKYYARPETYSIGDGYLRCQGLWMLYIDNNHKDCISVYLGDLGQQLPHQEQLHWKSYNILSEESISDVAFKRDFLASFEVPQVSDLKFKSIFTSFNKKWIARYGWELFLPLSEDDEYNLKSLRIPLNDSQEEFDHQVLSLVKTIIDSLNEKEIEKQITQSGELKGISKLKKWFEKLQLSDYEPHIKFLRNLQELRSSGTGHRKGKNYEKISKVFKLDEKSHMDVFDEILLQAIELIEYLYEAFNLH